MTKFWVLVGEMEDDYKHHVWLGILSLSTYLLTQSGRRGAIPSFRIRDSVYVFCNDTTSQALR
jgi:hypothetical protein